MPEDQTDSGDTMKTIAIIDDDIHIGDMLEEILTKEGYSVLRAYSGTEALYLLSNKKMDLVLLDLMLPGLSGEEVLPHIGKIPVIVLSAKVDVQDKVNLLLGGAADYMTKPFDTKELLARITVQLRRAEQHGQSGVLSVGDLALDTETFSLTGREADPDRICHSEAFDGKSQTGHCKERPSGTDQHGHAGLYPEVFETAHQQPA